MQRLAVQDVIIRYAQLLDTGQTHRVAEEIFTEDAVIDYGAPNPVTGRAAIAAFFAGFSDMLGTSHNLSNFIVDITGDTAHCLSHCMAWHWSKREGAPIAPADFVAVGGYEDQLRLADGKWRIAHRRMLSFGTGLGIGSVLPAVTSLMQGMLGRRPERL
jgi:ketosteroid isomerase-like protein